MIESVVQLQRPNSAHDEDCLEACRWPLDVVVVEYPTFLSRIIQIQLTTILPYRDLIFHPIMSITTKVGGPHEERT
jgi:hypothetical protein